MAVSSGPSDSGRGPHPRLPSRPPAVRRLPAAAEPGARWHDPAPEFLAERDGQVRRLSRRVAELRLGRAGMATVLGTPGTGRTALLRAVVARAREAGSPAVLATCSPAEADLRYGVVTQIASELAGAGFPVLSPGRWAADQTPAALIPALCGEFVALAREHPLLIAIDDAQWADEESKAWLAAMTRRLLHSPILLVQAGTLDDGGAIGSSPEPGPVAYSVVHVPPLSVDGVRQVIASRYAGPVDEAFVTAAAEATAGSPAALRAVLDHFAVVALPPAARHLPHLLERAAEVSGNRVAASLACLPPDALALLRVIVVCAGSLGFDLLTSLAAPRTMSPGQALSVLQRLGLVIGEDHPCPADSVVADMALAGMDVGERQALTARAVELGYRAAIAEDRLARLLLNARPVGAGWVVPLLRQVAGRRLLDGDHEGAAALLGRALREPLGGEQRQRLLIELATAEAGRSPETGDRRFQQVLLNSGPEVPVSVLVRAADLLGARGDAPAAYRAVATAYGRREGGAADVGPLAAVGWLAENECATDPVLPARSFPEPPDGADDPVTAGVAAWMLAIRGQSMPRARELARIALRSKGEDRPFGPRMRAAWVLCLADEVAEAVIGLEEVLADARRCGARAPAARALLLRGRCEMRRGNLGQAVSDFEAARAELPLTSWHPRMVPYLAGMEACLRLAGRSVEEAKEALARELPAGADQGPAWALLLYARARVNLELADPEAALRDINECGRLLLSRGWANPALLSWRSVAAEAYHACGNGEAARRLAMEAVERAREWGAPSALGVAHLCGARVLSGAEAMNELEHAVRILRGSVSRGSYARALILLEEATKMPMPSVGSTAAVHRVAGRTRTEGPAAPRRTPRPPAAHEGLLTAQESRIAALAAAGRTNAYIADILSVSVRTVELRLTGIYRKIAVSGRKELAARLVPVAASRNVGE